MAKAGRKPDKKKPGPKPQLDDILFSNIRKLIIDGKTLKEIADICGIEINTFYGWTADNYLNLADKIEGWKRDRKLMLAEVVIEDMLTMPTERIKIELGDEDEDGIKKEKQVLIADPALVKIKQDTAKFVAETLGKDHYAKRNELTGKDGEKLIPITEEAKNKSNTAIDEYLNQGNPK